MTLAIKSQLKLSSRLIITRGFNEDEEFGLQSYIKPNT